MHDLKLPRFPEIIDNFEITNEVYGLRKKADWVIRNSKIPTFKIQNQNRNIPKLLKPVTETIVLTYGAGKYLRREMIEHIYSIICADIITDAQTKTTSYIKTIDQIVSQGFPVIVPSLCISTYWTSEEPRKKEFAIRLHISTPEQERFKTLDIKNIPGIKLSQRFNFHIQNFKMESEGQYMFEVEVLLDDAWYVADTAILPALLMQESPPVEN